MQTRFALLIATALTACSKSPPEQPDRGSPPAAATAASPQTGPASAAKAPEPELDPEPYRDPNGYFTVHPPKGWRVQTKPGDPRGKVTFHASDPEGSFSISLLASEHPEYTSRESLLEGLREHMAEARAALGANTTLEATDWLGNAAVRRTMTVRDSQRTEAIVFMVGSVKHDLQYGGSTRVFTRHAPLAQRALETYLALEKGKRSTAAHKLAHELANFRRLAELFEKMGQPERALAYVGQGLAQSPADPALLAIKARLDGPTAGKP